MPKKDPAKRGSLRRTERRGFTALRAVLLNADQLLGGRGNPFVDEFILKDALAVIMTWKCSFFEFLNGKVTTLGSWLRNGTTPG